MRPIDWSRWILYLSFFFFNYCSPSLCISFSSCCGTNPLGALHLTKTAIMYPYGKNAAASAIWIINTVFQWSSVLQHVHSPGQNFCFLQFYSSKQMLGSVWNSEWHLLLSLLFLVFVGFFFCLVGCLVGLLLLRQIYPCTKAVIFYNIGKVIWPSFFLLMGWGDCFLPGLSVSALYFWYMGLGLLDVSISQLQIPTVSSFPFSCCRQSPVQHFRKSGYRPALMLWTCHLVLLAVLLVEK